MSDSRGEDERDGSPEAPAAPKVPSRSRCPLCGELFLEPRILPCLHTFCTACLGRLEPFSDLAWHREDSDSSSDGSWLWGQQQNHLSPPALSILCPVCDAEVDLPPGGVEGLPTDHLALNGVLLEALQGAGLGVACDLCVDGEAVKRCQACRVCLCQFCCQAHKRQKKTASHAIVELQDLKGFTRLEKPIQCPSHPSEELKLFCERCDSPVCQECVVGAHRQHPCNLAANVVHKHGDSIRELLKATQGHAGALRGALSRIEGVWESLGRRAEAVALEIRAFADGYARAVEEHRDRLLRSLEELKVQRETQLHLQKAQLEQLLLDMQTGVDFTQRLLAGGSDLEILLTKGVVENRLRRLNSVDFHPHPVSDDKIQFSPHEKAGLVHGYEMFGAVLNRAADPTKCVLQGKDVGGTRQSEPVALTLLCKDGSGEQLERGGEPVRVTVSHKDGKDGVAKAVVRDNQDGTYHISYTPEEPGKYTISIFVRGQHVQGSPFTMAVKSKFRQHLGLFHCCTFCSSGGKKAARCACGGTMPGGYQGCGHGHKGHPGSPHWSCCGNVEEASECSIKPAREDPLQRSLLRTVVL
uniref:tripartite motif-containing protein 45 n=1 Tax=Euleptes europaea TaxID=460621 RepID=UPI00253FDF51|nr:tripartite motif-containing protein 45 [Euleptes europaea]